VYGSVYRLCPRPPIYDIFLFYEHFRLFTVSIEIFKLHLYDELFIWNIFYDTQDQRNLPSLCRRIIIVFVLPRADAGDSFRTDVGFGFSVFFFFLQSVYLFVFRQKSTGRRRPRKTTIISFAVLCVLVRPVFTAVNWRLRCFVTSRAVVTID